MVENITSLTRNGLRDWLVQRISAIILAVYTLFILGFIVWHQPLDYSTWHQLFSLNWMRIFSLLALLSLLAHTWIGIWTITTDYLKCACVRLITQVIVMLALFGCLIWGILILWSL
ncbi:MAG: sdhD [Gammaproteobacteria bacterium]|jgi:succinate dehydrogenase / fumarate reductase membrane anchor subunit|nr:sdhD [Gammaproteobacteria bacterium]